MSENVYMEIALAQISSNARKQRRVMAARDAKSVADVHVLAYIQPWHNPADPLPAPSITIPLLRKAWHNVFGDDYSRAPWNIKCCIIREITRAHARKLVAS